MRPATAGSVRPRGFPAPSMQTAWAFRTAPGPAIRTPRVACNCAPMAVDARRRWPAPLRPPRVSRCAARAMPIVRRSRSAPPRICSRQTSAVGRSRATQAATAAARPTPSAAHATCARPHVRVTRTAAKATAPAAPGSAKRRASPVRRTRIAPRHRCAIRGRACARRSARPARIARMPAPDPHAVPEIRGSAGRHSVCMTATATPERPAGFSRERRATSAGAAFPVPAMPTVMADSRRSATARAASANPPVKARSTATAAMRSATPASAGRPAHPAAPTRTALHGDCCATCAPESAPHNVAPMLAMRVVARPAPPAPEFPAAA